MNKQDIALGGAVVAGIGGSMMMTKPLAAAVTNASFYFTPAALAQSAAQTVVIHKVGLVVLGLGLCVFVGFGTACVLEKIEKRRK